MNERFVDEAYFTAVLTERTRTHSSLLTDAVVVHFAFAFQRMGPQAEVSE